MGPAASDQEHPDCDLDASAAVTSRSGIWFSCSMTAMSGRRICLGLGCSPSRRLIQALGLERLAAVMVNADDPQKFSNYDTDLFIPLIERAKELTGVSEVYPYRTTSQGRLRFESLPTTLELPHFSSLMESHRRGTAAGMYCGRYFVVDSGMLVYSERPAQSLVRWP